MRVKASPAPYFNLEEEFETQQAVKGLIADKLINAAHDVFRWRIVCNINGNGYAT